MSEFLIFSGVFIIGLVFGIAGGGAAALERASKHGRFTWSGTEFRVEPMAITAQEVTETEVISAVNKGMRAGAFDAEIERVNLRNNQRRS